MSLNEERRERGEAGESESARERRA